MNKRYSNDHMRIFFNKILAIKTKDEEIVQSNKVQNESVSIININYSIHNKEIKEDIIVKNENVDKIQSDTGRKYQIHLSGKNEE